MARLDETTASAVIRRRLRDSIEILETAVTSSCVEQAASVAATIVKCVSTGGKVLFFGNGGSAMDAGHLAAELLGRFQLDRPPLPGLSLADNTASMTAISNDFDYADAFARQVRGLGAPGDVLVGLTTSGQSENVIRALETGRSLGMFTVAITGSKGTQIATVSDICVRVPSEDPPRIQEISMQLGHTICELVEAALYGPRAHQS